MGKVIICTGRLAEKPFIVPESERTLYSIEEICFYVASNIYEIELGFFSEELLLYIEKELELPEVSEKLRSLLKEGHGLNYMITALMCSSDLYDREEIIEIINMLNRIAGMEAWEKRAHIGYKYLKEGRYLLALKYFRGVLKEEKISEKDYGRVLMSVGLCLIYTSSYKEAADCFYKAYKHNRNKKILSLTLLSLRLGNLQSEYEEKIEKIAEDDPILKEVNDIWNMAEREAVLSEEYKNLEKMLAAAEEDGDDVKLGKKLEEFKNEYREGSRHGIVS